MIVEIKIIGAKYDWLVSFWTNNLGSKFFIMMASVMLNIVEFIHFVGHFEPIWNINDINHNHTDNVALYIKNIMIADYSLICQQIQSNWQWWEIMQIKPNNFSLVFHTTFKNKVICQQNKKHYNKLVINDPFYWIGWYDVHQNIQMLIRKTRTQLRNRLRYFIGSSWLFAPFQIDICWIHGNCMMSYNNKCILPSNCR